MTSFQQMFDVALIVNLNPAKLEKDTQQKKCQPDLLEKKNVVRVQVSQTVFLMNLFLYFEIPSVNHADLPEIVLRQHDKLQWDITPCSCSVLNAFCCGAV